MEGCFRIGRLRSNLIAGGRAPGWLRLLELLFTHVTTDKTVPRPSPHVRSFLEEDLPRRIDIPLLAVLTDGRVALKHDCNEDWQITTPVV